MEDLTIAGTPEDCAEEISAYDATVAHAVAMLPVATDLVHAVSGHGPHGNRRVVRRNLLCAFLRRAGDGQILLPTVRHSVQNRLVATALD